jgi:hypothetical protein
VHWIHPDALPAYALKLETSSTTLHSGWISENKENSDAPCIEDEEEDCL